MEAPSAGGAIRIVSLVPAATEIVAALGGAHRLVGISHECDYPPFIRHLPRLTATPIDDALPSAAIDAHVRRLREAGRPVFTVEAETLRRLAPDLILTQDLCEVCAVADGTVQRLAATMRPAPAVIPLNARDLTGIWRDISTVGAALDLADEAEELIAGLESRLRRLRAEASDGGKRRVVCLEWLEPVYLAGHWVPELVALAGGNDVGAEPGSHSVRRSWRHVHDTDPELLLVMLCGFDVDRTRKELAQLEHADARELFRRIPTWIMDGNAYTSRPGPRVVDGAARIRAALDGRTMPGLVRWQE